ncbi:MAG: hypothetical protein LJE59_14195 [Chromatiaceae bacterium]|nr:hypothetical protein [Chromatiaceae bacterium]
MIHQRLETGYNPLYFLAALGAGGIAMTFYAYLMFMVEHPDAPVVTIDHLWPILSDGNPLAGAFAGLAMLAMLLFALLHIRLLVWNLFEYHRYRGTEAYRRLRAGHSETSLMAIPLTLAMSVNVLFMAAMALVPNLWRHAESALPVALVAFLGIGGQALFLYARFLIRVLRSGQFAGLADHGLAQMIAVFAFAMVALGLAAPGCMSQQAYAGTIGVAGAVLFAAIAAGLGVVKLGLGLRSALKDGISASASPGLWIVIPVLTLLGIVLIRLELGPLQGFDRQLLQPGLFTLTAVILSLQLLFGVLGYIVMRRLGYFRDYLHGSERHPASYALICPGIALFMFGMYFVNYGLVKTGLVDSLSLAYFALLAPFALVQFKSIVTMFRLNRRLLGNPLLV